jgi:hypothetical protein
MLTFDLWKYYFIFVASTLIAYYALILFRFCRGDLKTLFSKSARRQDISPIPLQETFKDAIAEPAGLVTENSVESSLWEDPEAFELAVSLSDALKTAIGEAYGKNYSKDDLLALLQMILGDYVSLGESPHRLSIIEFIQTECAKYGSIHLSTAEITKVWRKLD